MAKPIYQKIIAADFDGTIKSKNDVNEIESPPVDHAIEAIKNLHKNYNCRFILNTCREGEYLEQAKIYLKQHGILDCFELFNENIPELPFQSRKIFANYYIDDLNAGGLYSWDLLEKEVIFDIKTEISSKFKKFYHGTSYKNFRLMATSYNPYYGLFSDSVGKKWTLSKQDKVYFYGDNDKSAALDAARLTSAVEDSESTSTVLVELVVPEPLWELFEDDKDTPGAFCANISSVNKEIKKNHITASFLIEEKTYDASFRPFYLIGADLDFLNVSDSFKDKIMTAKEICKGAGEISDSLYFDNPSNQETRVPLSFFDSEKNKGETVEFIRRFW